MANFQNLVKKVIEQSEILLLVVDARRLELSINQELEEKVEAAGKKYLYVVNKIDLLTPAQVRKLKLPQHSIVVSAQKHQSTMTLLRRINGLARGGEVVVGVIGYPNTGKSTLINAMKGRHSASTSSVSGHTKGLQRIRVNKNILLIDTPGVFSKYDENKTERLHIGVLDPSKIKDPVTEVSKLFIAHPDRVKELFGITVDENDPNDAVEQIAIKQNMLKKGGVGDLGRAAKYILGKWQE